MRLPGGLLTRLVCGAVVIAIASTVATAWLVARSTSVAIEREQGEALSGDTSIYTTLLTYAATHPDWTAVGPAIAELQESTGRQITLTTSAGQRIAGYRGSLARTASAVVDALNVDPTIVTDGPEDGISPAAVGPYQLTRQEIRGLSAVAEAVLKCAGTGEILQAPNGRPVLDGLNPVTLTKCTEPTSPASLSSIDEPRAQIDLTGTESRAYSAVTQLTNGCLTAQGQPRIEVGYNFITSPQRGDAVPTRSILSACLTESRKTQLDPYVTSPALLYLNSPSRATAEFDLSTDLRRAAGVGSAVLVATIAIAVLGAVRWVGPIRALTRAARQMAHGDQTARVSATGRSDEIGELSVAFNEMADARARTEAQRRAMVSDIAHELRTPLSNIRGLLEAVQDDVYQPDEAFIESLSEEATLLRTIIDDLQDLATADAGQLRVHPERVHLVTVLDQCLERFRQQASASGTQLTADADDALELEADPQRLRQMIGNLLSNALRHTDYGSVQVVGRVEDAWVAISVIDTGSGIDAADLPHVFDRFWRADPSRSRQHGGSGLGLAIVRSLVEAHGGTATAASTAGCGTTITLRLPIDGPVAD